MSMGMRLEFWDAARIRNRSVMDSQIRRWMTKKHVPGLAACVVRGTDVVWSGGYGFANLNRQIPFTPDQTIFQIASISKTVTATAIMQLTEMGLLALDDDINTYLGFQVRNAKFPDIPITFRHLLTHTSSIRDDESIYALYAAGDPTMTLRDAVSRYFPFDGKLANRKLFRKKPPGAEVRYSNLGFALLGYLVEVVGQMPLEDFLQQNIFAPLRMSETSFYIAKLDPLRQACPYTYAKSPKGKLCPGDGDGNLLPEGARPKSGFNEHALYSYPTLADGMVRTSVHQLANFMIAMMNDGRLEDAQILKKETIDAQLPAKGPGLGWFRAKKYWGHDGSDPGCATEMWFNIQKKVGVIVFANTEVELDKIVRLLKARAED
jgi:CubicO group peptidase (beta-lactamase class C family)